MRRMSYDEEKRRPRQPSPTVNLPPQERVRRVPRDPDEQEAISRMSQAKWDLYIASGKLEIIEPRKWRLHLGQEKIIEYLRQQGKL
jgi:hypothetical protein